MSDFQTVRDLDSLLEDMGLGVVIFLQTLRERIDIVLKLKDGTRCGTEVEAHTSEQKQENQA